MVLSELWLSRHGESVANVAATAAERDGNTDKLPKLFWVNWFRKGEDGSFLWPGFGENSRVLKWVIERVNGEGTANDTAIGRVPSAAALDLEGLGLEPGSGATPGLD